MPTLNTEAQTPQKGIPFATLQKGIQDWLKSDIVTDVIITLNERYGAFGSEVRILPRLITRVSVGMTPPELFTKELGHYLAFLEPADAARLAFEVKSRIFKPIHAALKAGYDIDTDKIITVVPPATPVARTMKLESTPAPKPPTPPAVRQIPVAPRAPAVPQPKARIMEIQHVIDLRKPSPQAASTPVKKVASPVPPAPAARTMEMSQSSVAKPTTPVASAKPTTPAPKKPAEESKVLESEKPFGLAEAIPKPPAPQEIEKYHDEHPEVIANGDTK